MLFTCLKIKKHYYTSTSYCINMTFTFQHEWRDHAAPIYSISPYLANHFFTGGADKVLALWESENEQNLPFHVKIDFGIYHVNYNQTNDHIYIAESKGGVHVIDKAQKKEIAYLLGHKKGVYKTLFLEAKNWLVCLGGDGNCSIWDTQNYKHVKSFELSDGKLRDAWYDEQTSILWIVGAHGLLASIDVTNLTIKKTIPVGSDALYTLCPHPTKPDVLLCAGKDALIYAVNINTHKTFSFPAHHQGIYRLLVIPNTAFLVSCSRDKSIKIWNISDYSFHQKIERKNQQGHTASVNDMIWLPETQQLISVGDDKRIIAWKVDCLPK